MTSYTLYGVAPPTSIYSIKICFFKMTDCNIALYGILVPHTPWFRDTILELAPPFYRSMQSDSDPLQKILDLPLYGTRNLATSVPKRWEIKNFQVGLNIFQKVRKQGIKFWHE